MVQSNGVLKHYEFFTMMYRGNLQVSTTEKIDKETNSEAINEVSTEPEAKNKLSPKTLGIIIGCVAGFFVAIIIFVSNYLNASSIVDDIEETPVALMFIEEESDPKSGGLYYKQIDGKKEKIASGVYEDSFSIFGNNDVIYLNKNNELYVKKYGAAEEKISSNVQRSSYMISENENAVVFMTATADSDIGELYIAYFGENRENICKNLSRYSLQDFGVSADGSTVYYIDNENNFYKWTRDAGNEKIASGIGSFKFKEDAYLYTTQFDQNSEKVNTYLKLTNEIDGQKIASNYVYDVEFLNDGMAVAYITDYTYREEMSYGELYISVGHGESIKVGSDVKSFKFSPDYSYIYFIDADGTLFTKKIPTIDKSVKDNPSKFRDALLQNEKKALADDVIIYNISENGENLALVDSQNVLYVLKNQGERVKVDTDVEEFKITDSRLIYRTTEDKLYLNSNIENTKKAKDNSNLIAIDVKVFSSTPQGRYIAFYNKEKDDVRICVDGQKPEILVNNAVEYDDIYYKHRKIYENVLEMSDLAGKYKNDELGYLFEIKENGEISWYNEGKKETGELIIYSSVDRYTSIVGITPYSSYLIFEYFNVKDGACKIKFNEEYYDLINLSDEEYESEIQNQLAIEKQKKEEEKRKEELEKKINDLKEKGRSYQRTGVQVTPSTSIYLGASVNLLEKNLHYTEEKRASVRSYEVSADGTKLWLELYDTYLGDHVWILAN